jgi:hypothetical protein
VQPCTVREFMNYLKYIERSAENLQFYLWHRDYSKRFGELPASEQALSPEWTVEQAEREINATKDGRRTWNVSPDAAAVLKGTAFDLKSPNTESIKETDPFHTPPRTPSEGKRDAGSMETETTERFDMDGKSTYAKKAEGAFEDAGLKWQPCTSTVLLVDHPLTGHCSHCPTLP